MESVLEIIKGAVEFEQEQTAKAKNRLRTNPLNIKVEKNWRKESERINSEGVKKFGWDWVRANEAAIAAASDFGANYEHRQIAAFVQTVVFSVLDRIHTSQH